MGFWQRNWEKITTDTISDVMIRLLVPILLGLGGAYVGIKFIAQPIDSGTNKELIGLIRHVIVVIYCLLLFKLSDILIWSSQKRKDRIREKELENENLKLQLELRQQEPQSVPERKK